MTRSSVLGSGLVHVALLVVLFLVRAPGAIVIPGPEVVQVSLMDANETSPPVPAPTPPEPTPEAKVEEIKPTPETGVKLQPEKTKVKPKKDEERKESARSTSTITSSSASSPGLTGALSVDGANFEFTYYLVAVQRKIMDNWTPPSGLGAQGQRVQATVYFKITRGGEIASARIENGSGFDFFDRTALRSVVISDPLPPLPLGFAGSEVGIRFEFLWVEP